MSAIKLELLKRPLKKQKKKDLTQKLKFSHPFVEGEYLPVYIANFVLMSYGTGAIFGVPAHDQRDLDFANKLSLPIKRVVESKNLEENK